MCENDEELKSGNYFKIDELLNDSFIKEKDSCANCSMDTHTENCPNTPTCLNCRQGPPHPPISKECPKYKTKTAAK